MAPARPMARLSRSQTAPGTRTSTRTGVLEEVLEVGIAALRDEDDLLAADLHPYRSHMVYSPESPDVVTLAGALARRMRPYIARDGRLRVQAARPRPDARRA